MSLLDFVRAVKPGFCQPKLAKAEGALSVHHSLGSGDWFPHFLRCSYSRPSHLLQPVPFPGAEFSGRMERTYAPVRPPIAPMIQLYGVEYSPFVIVQRRILEFGQVPYKNVKVPYHD